MVDGRVEALLTHAAEVLDEAALRGLADCLGKAQAEPAPVRYRRLIDELGRLPAGGRSAGRSAVADFLATDAVVLARMSAAVEVMRAAGFEVDTVGGIAEHLHRAVRWRLYGGGPVPELHRHCAADIVRGSLRLWAQAGGTPQPVSETISTAAVRNQQARAVAVRGQVQLARVQFSTQARMACTALRTELSREAAQLSCRGLSGFEGRVRGELLRVATDFDEAVSRRLAGLAPAAELPDQPGPAVESCLPPHRWPRLENRLTALLGVGFGFSVSLAAARVVAELRPEWTSAPALVCGALGLLLTAWVVAARRLLNERAAAERAVVEATANLRAALQEQVLTRILTLESALAIESVGPVLNRREQPVGDTPN